MHGDDTLGNRQAKPRPGLCLGGGTVSLLELFENLALIAGVDSGSGVAHRERIIAVAGRSSDHNLTGFGEFDRITDEVEENLGESPLVAVRDWQIFWQFDRERKALFCGQRFHDCKDAVDDILD